MQQIDQTGLSLRAKTGKNVPFWLGNLSHLVTDQRKIAASEPEQRPLPVGYGAAGSSSQGQLAMTIVELWAGAFTLRPACRSRKPDYEFSESPSLMFCILFIDLTYLSIKIKREGRF